MMKNKASLLVLCLLAALLAGCQTPVRLMPTPVKFTTGEIDPFQSGGPLAQGNEVPVLYATNRGLLIDVPQPIYTIFPSERLRMGVAHVRIGDEKLSWEELHALSTSADAGERPIVKLEKLEPMATLGPDDKVKTTPEAQAFFAYVNKALAASPNSELVVYVHGANNVVPRAAAQASQFRHFTGRRMVVLSFIWPSAGSFLSYATDVRNAAASAAPFARLMELLAENTKASQIDVLAYSAGAQVASPGLALLGVARDGESRVALRQRLRLGQVYFAAPDVDTRAFVEDLRGYADVAARVSVAANLNDSVLVFARIAGGASRAGRPNPTELSESQTRFLIDATKTLDFDLLKVDPNDIPGLPRRSHTFWYDDPWVSSDVVARFLFNASPAQRGLEAQAGSEGLRYWTFPPDFDRRVIDLVRRIAPPQKGAE
ncbi:alpha/beta hydrolase [Rivibacter subsaxonicus]|uniref:Esterase/lipase superfamily enzyme n=1 Tax=Rivibacter subsaxonicus TaxID=457575 RepID=A0A4Q7W149_9BURK|nr:alpha/beta hydrolase [Rivibacter subsaxonicus]RZU02628.1 esterase/lipase superfamily enzyme [Rivibacter subsaxonicus]